MPSTVGDVVSYLNNTDEVTAYIEQVPFGMAGGKFFAAMAKLQRQAGQVEGVCQALGFRIVMVPPQKWQKALGLGNRKDHDKQWKNHLKAEAQRLYPNINVTLKTADALLLLEYARKDCGL